MYSTVVIDNGSSTIKIATDGNPQCRYKAKYFTNTFYS